MSALKSSDFKIGEEVIHSYRGRTYHCVVANVLPYTIVLEIPDNFHSGGWVRSGSVDPSYKSVLTNMYWSVDVSTLSKKTTYPTIEEVRKRYPIGTVYRSLSGSKNTIDSFNWVPSGKPNIIYGEDGKGILYRDGEWAEVIHGPKSQLEKKELTTEEILAYALENYPNGTKFHPVGSSKVCTVKDIRTFQQYSHWLREWCMVVSTNEHSANGEYIYKHGEWAKIISKPSSNDSTDGKYKVGDTVQLCEGPELPPGWVRGMEKFFGRVCVIEAVKSNGIVYFEQSGDNVDMRGYSINVRCIQKLIKPAPSSTEAESINVDDWVVITGNSNGSRNCVGDIGKVTKIEGSGYRILYKVTVDGRHNYDNWTKSNELRLATKEEIAKKESRTDITTVKESSSFEYKFKKGDVVEVCYVGSGCPSDDLGKVVTITELGEYSSKPGYKVSPPIGNSRTGMFGGFIGEKSFRLAPYKVSTDSVSETVKGDFSTSRAFVATHAALDVSAVQKVEKNEGWQKPIILPKKTSKKFKIITN